MKLAQSRVTAQGQISVPAEVRKRLELVPGSVLEWDAEGDHITVRRVGRHTFEDLHGALFSQPPPPAEPGGAQSRRPAEREGPPCAPLTPASSFAC